MWSVSEGWVSGLAKEIYFRSGENVYLCFQCQKCSSGCPVNFAMDYTPAQLLDAIRLGEEDLVLSSKTAWLCACCETCTTRCPQELDLAKVMDTVKMIAMERRIPALPKVFAFYDSFLSDLKIFGRIYELGLIMWLKLRTKEFTKDLGLGMEMMKKGNLKILPHFVRPREVQRIFSKVMELERGKK